MKRTIYALCGMMAIALSLTSCLKDDDDDATTVTYNETAITNFSLSVVNRYVHTESGTGADSVYKKLLTVKDYPFTIDHYKRKIYNTDSLPADCDLKHVLATISSSTYSGNIVLKSLVGDTLYLYSSSDSLDFSQPRELRVYNLNQDHYRAYTVQVNIKQEISTSLLTWEEADASVLVPKTVQTTDISQDGFRLSVDGGTTWTEERLSPEEDAAYLPTGEVGYTAFLSDSYGTTYHLMVGPFEGNDYMCSIWRKRSTDGNGTWTCLLNLPLPTDKKYAGYLPSAEHVSLAYGNGRIMALLDDGNVYESLDQGFSWHKSTDYNLPTSATDHLRALQDSDGTIWLLKEDSGELWRGNFKQ